jgi:hypothetical protein
MAKPYTFTSKIAVYPGMGGWRFLGIPKKEAKEIKETYGKNAKGWGSLPVTVTIGKTAWKTSIFPDRKSGTYLLPLKAQIRKKEEIDDDETVRFILELML